MPVFKRLSCFAKLSSLKYHKLIFGKPSYDLFINTGLYVFKKSTINFIPKNKNFDIQELIEKLKKSKKKIGIFPINQNSWFDVGQWTEYNKTNSFFNNEK